eukprot:scaffold103100_cov57-Phaeocystis_antarctica.AAC.4
MARPLVQFGGDGCIASQTPFCLCSHERRPPRLALGALSHMLDRGTFEHLSVRSAPRTLGVAARAAAGVATFVAAVVAAKAAVAVGVAVGVAAATKKAVAGVVAGPAASVVAVVVAIGVARVVAGAVTALGARV